MSLRGIDVSSHQPVVDWEKVARAGYRFAIVKLSEGQDFADPKGKAHLAGARRAGLLVGVYHYLRPRPGRSGAVEADWAVKVAKAAGWGRPGDIRLVVDVEETALSSPAQTRAYLSEFVERAVLLTGHRPLIYTFPSFAQRLALPGTLGCPLWLAHFGVATPSVPKPWRRYTIWQHSSTGRVPGISGNVDLNVADRLPLIGQRKPLPKPPPKGRARTRARMRRARRKYLDTRADQALRVYLISKARLGLWDERYLLHHGVNGNVNTHVRRFFTRAYAAGLVPTSGRRAPRFAGDRSHHIEGAAGDAGVRRELLGTPEQARRLHAFQRAEFERRNKTRPAELIGPDNWRNVLRGRQATLAEGTALENQHDNHVHFARPF